MTKPMLKEKEKPGWDLGLDFKTTYKQLLNFYNANKNPSSRKAMKRKLYAMILLTQLYNGSRIGEAIALYEKIYQIGEYKKTEFYIPVEKQRNPELRLMIIPKDISPTDIASLKAVFEEFIKGGRRKAVIKISAWIKKRFNWNTHSLRYAFVGFLSKQHVAPQIIAKTTKHKKLDMILKYTQEKEAETILKKELREWVKR